MKPASHVSSESPTTSCSATTNVGAAPRVMIERLFRKKDMHHVIEMLRGSELKRHLGLWNLVSLGVGFVIGAGIFVITGQAAAKYAGPALSLSFVLCVIPCGTTGLCYGELASMVPVAGSAYSFSLMALGELPAWIVGMCLSLETLVTASAVAVGWSATVQALLAEGGVHLPFVLSGALLEEDDDGAFIFSGRIVNFPSVAFIGALTFLLSRGIKESANVNNAAVVTKITVLVVFVMYGIYFALHHWAAFTDNLTPYVPPNKSNHFGKFGWSGVLRGASVVFFACFGFDGMCSYAQECTRPQRDLPLAMMITIAISTSLYVAVTTVLTGMVHYTQLDVDSPVVEALVIVGAPSWLRYVVEVGAIAGITSATLVALMSMPRLMLILAQDGLLPPWLGRVHPHRQTPFNATMLAGALAMLFSGLFPLALLAELVSFGTLVAFGAVCASAWRLRVTHPKEHREFVAPWFPVTPIIGILSCVAQLAALPFQTWRNYSFCLAAAVVFYFSYSMHHSRLATAAAVDDDACHEKKDGAALQCISCQEDTRTQDDEEDLSDATVVRLHGEGDALTKS
jgi:basic amino acid/polyamine antiporter, APA family